MSFCSKCGKEVKEGNKFCPDCGTEIEVLHKIVSSMSVAELAKIEGIKQRIAQYESEYKMLLGLMGLCILGGTFFWIVTLWIEFYAWALQVIAVLLWIVGALSFVGAFYRHTQADKLREKLGKGEID